MEPHAVNLSYLNVEDVVFQLKRYETEVLETIILLLFLPENSSHMAHTLFLQHTKIFHLDDITNEDNKKHNLKWLYISRSSIHNVNNWRFWIKKS